MGVHKKPGMNTATATVDCGPVFCEKEVREHFLNPLQSASTGQIRRPQTGLCSFLMKQI